MSRWSGRLITRNPVTPGGTSPTASAPGIWTLPEMAYWKKQGLWPDASADAYWGYVSYLMSTSSLSNANNNLFVDSSGAFNPVTRSGNATQGAVTPYGTLWSNYFDGSGDYITAPNNAAFNFGTGDFTAECWVYQTNNTAYQRILSYGQFGAAGNFQLEATTDTSITVHVNGGYVSTTVPSLLNTWTHIAVVRTSGSVALYTNGVLRSTNSQAGNVSTANVFAVAGQSDGSNNFYGYVSNVRIVKGTAVYTGAFTPSAIPLTAISGTSLLTCQSNRFRDASSNNFTITAYGNTSVTPSSPFVLPSPGAVYNQSDISYWSGYFNGSSYLSAPDSSGYALNSSGWTFETFVNFSALPASGNAASLAAQWYDGNLGWWFYLYNNAGTYQLYFSYSTNGSSQTNISVNLSAAPQLNTWNHIAYLYLSGLGVGIYWNGVLVGAFQSFSGTVFNSTSAIQIGARVGSAGAGYYLNGYLSNMRLVNAAGGSYIWPPTAPITAINGTTLLTLQSAAFTDNSTTNAVFTPVGNPVVTGNNPFQSGYYSNYFDGNGDGLSISSYSSSALAFGTSDFTIEFWAFATTAPNNNWTPFFTMGTSSAGQEIRIAQNINGTGFGWLYPDNSNTGSVYAGYGAMTTNTWHHIAMTRSGSTMRLFLDGAVVATGTGVSFNFTNTTLLRIGLPQPAYADGAFTGYLSNLRVVKGTAVYTAAFTPPTAPLTAISGTGLLTCQANRLIDSSSNAFALTAVGDTSVSPFDPFYTATIASNGGSMYFDGSGDYLTLPSSDLYRVDTGDWTMEAWLYPTSTGVQHTVMNRGVYLSTYSFYFGTNGTSVYYEAGTGGWAATPYTSSSGAIIAGQWNHIAVVRSGTSLLMYANGNRVLNQASASFGANVTAPLQIGAYLGGTAVVNGNLTDVRFTKGTALYTGSTYTIPTAPLTPSANTTLLLNGMNAGTYDAAMQNNLETVGNAQVSSAQAKFGTTSAYFDGSGDYLSMPSSPSLILGSSNFTAEAWFYAPSTVSSTQQIMGSWDGSSTLSWTVGLGATNKVLFVISTTGAYNPAFDIISTATFSTGTWNHLAFVRNGSAFNLYLNGVSVASLTNSSALYSYPQGTKIGGNTNSQWFNGYLDDVRITRGYARYTANFTPPTAALPIY